MTGLEIALLAVMGTLCLAGAGVGVFFYVRWRMRATNELVKVLGQYNKSIELYLASFEKGAEAMNTIPALMAGMVKLAQAEVKEIHAFRGEVKNLKDMIFRKDSNRVEVPSDEQKDFVFRAHELATEKQIGFDQALKMVIEEDARGLIEGEQFSL